MTSNPADYQASAPTSLTQRCHTGAGRSLFRNPPTTGSCWPEAAGIVIGAEPTTRLPNSRPRHARWLAESLLAEQRSTQIASGPTDRH